MKSNLGKFVGALSEEGVKQLVIAAKAYAHNRNFAVSGQIDFSSFNVEDIVGIGLLAKGVLKAFASTAAKGGSEALVQANRTAGNLFRDELAAALRAEGRTANTEAYKWTPFGKRYVDLDVWHNGVNLGGIEIKVGGSRYVPLQKLKDAWLGANGYPVNLVRKPVNW